MSTRRKFLQGVGGGLTGGILARALPVGVGALLWPRRAQAAIVLDTYNPANFQRQGGQSFTPGPVLTISDQSIGDVMSFFAPDADANAGRDIEVITTFQIQQSIGNNADSGNRIIINDGTGPGGKAAIAACVLINNTRGVAILGQGPDSDPTSYLAFVPVDWGLSTTIRLRRSANGDAELVEVNGLTPNPRALVAANQLANATRGNATVEFGCSSPEAVCVVDYAAFRSQPVAQAVAGTLTFTHFRVRDTDSADRLRFRADYTLGALSDGLNPAVEPVTIKLMTPAGVQFYPFPDINPLVGFDVQGKVGKRRWSLNDAERARTGIEQFVFDEGPNLRGGLAFRDIRTTLADADYSVITVEVTIGSGATQDKLTGTAQLVERPFLGGGKWKLANQP